MDAARMRGRAGVAAGFGYPALVPAALLPPEDPSAGRRRRTVRDWAVDLLIMLGSAGLAFVFWYGNVDTTADHPSSTIVVLDAALGAIGVVLLWWRRRWPVTIALLTTLFAVISAGAALASVVATFTVVVHRRSSVALAVAAANVGAGAIFPVLRPQETMYWVSLLIGVIVTVVVVAWGMFVRARRQLVWTLRERAERAEAEQQLHADRARSAERTRIAREMHDVLAHRISMLALHAGGLAVRPDLPPAEVAATAELLRSTAQHALEELRGVIGVLREDPGEAPSAPQPTLRDLPRLVDETRRAGAKIEFRMAVPDDAEPPGSLGRDAYRIVQEALTNVAKHAEGTATTVSVRGRPGDGLFVDVRNRLPVHAGGATLPGSGSGLLGLRERVSLAGGTLTHGPNEAGEFVVDARLAWTAQTASSA